MKPDHVIVKLKYSFWRHPIKWWKARKMRKQMQFILNHFYKDAEPELRKAQMDMFMYGAAAMKGGKHVSVIGMDPGHPDGDTTVFHIEPSGRTDYCVECNSEHGYYCPKIGA